MKSFSLRSECVQAVFYDGTNGKECLPLSSHYLYMEDGVLMYNSDKCVRNRPMETNVWIFRHPKGQGIRWMPKAEFEKLYFEATL